MLAGAARRRRRAGQKAQQDALLRPGLDLRPRGAGARRAPAAATTCRCRALPGRARAAERVGEGDARPVPLEPPAQGGAAGAARAASSARSRDLPRTKDGEWVTVGGMIAECKRIRTKKGDPMMFATLDDLEGQVEMLVFNSAYAANADKVDVDADRDRARPGGPQGGGRDEAGRPGGRAVRALARGGAARAPRRRRREPVVRRLSLHVLAGRAGELPRGAQGGRGAPPGRPRAAAGGRRAAPAAGPDYRVSADSACRAELSGAARRGARRRRSEHAAPLLLHWPGATPIPRRPRPSCTSAGSAAPSATGSCTRRAASRRAASTSTSTTTRRPAAASWAA